VYLGVLAYLSRLSSGSSNPIKVIVYVCLNDEDTLRKTGAKTDVYHAFTRMLARGVVPASIQDLLEESSKGEG